MSCKSNIEVITFSGVGKGLNLFLAPYLIKKNLMLKLNTPKGT